jgi:hypothetical protein
VQTLTRHQIAAIPKERFSAGEFGAESRGQIISAMKMADDCLANECLVL